MPERFAEALCLALIQKNNRLQVNNDDCTQSFKWVDQLPIAESMRNHLLPATMLMPGQIRFRPP